MTTPRSDRYGHVRAVKIYARIEALRQAIRREGTPAVQDAWDALEPYVHSPHVIGEAQ